jgi:hypothetical protein
MADKTGKTGKTEKAQKTGKTGKTGKSVQPRRTKVVIGSIVAVVLATGLAFGGYHLLSRNAGTDPLVDAYSPDKLKSLAGQPGALREHMRSLRDRDNLTDEQRRQIRENMRETFRSMMDERANEYFNAPDDKKDEVLDRHLDEFEQRRREWEAERARDRNGPERPPADGPPRDGARRRGPFNSTPAERKARSESRSPDQRAKHMAYHRALRKRAEERGINLPFGRGPGGGPPGQGGRPGGRGGDGGRAGDGRGPGAG